MEITVVPKEGKTFQQEPMKEFVGGHVVNGGIFRPSSLFSKQASEMLEAVKGVRGSAPPPFLSKTFKMVEDPETDTMISWNSCGTTLIIRDHLKFASEVLPKYFRHSNFSSFIYQLNNYGFRKIGLRKFEYENTWFQAGQEHLLKNIKRRNDENPTSKKKRGLKQHCFTAHECGMEVDLEKARDNMDSFMVEIPKLKHQLGEFESQINTFKQNVEKMESKSNNLMMFLARIFSPSLVQKMIQRVDEEQELESHETVKRRRLVAPESSENSAKPMDEINNPGQGVNDKNKADDLSNPLYDQEANHSIPKANERKQYDALWKKFMGDDSDSENESEQELAKQHSKLYMALDDNNMLVSKIVTELEGVNAKEDNIEVEDEVTLQLWA